MSEDGAAAPKNLPSQPAQKPPPEPPSAGAMLRRMREAAGVDMVRLASVLKVPQSKLQALEEDRLDALPDLTFARGLASAVCRILGVAPAPVLERMPVRAPGLRTPEHRVNPPLPRSGSEPTGLMAGSLTKPLLIAVAVLLIGAALLWLLPPLQSSAPPETAVPSPAAHSASADQPTQTEPVPATPPVDAASVEQTASAPAAAASVADVAAASAPAAAAPADDVLGLTANGQTWVAVRDATGKVLTNTTLVAGQTISLGGQLPLSVTIGRKEAVAVTVRGKPFNIKSRGSSQMVHFTVK